MKRITCSGKLAAMLLIALFLITESAWADSICDVVLKSGAFNTSDYYQSSRILQAKRDDVCHSEYNSLSEANSAASGAGASIGYGPFSFGASETKQTASGKYSIADSKFCRATAEQLDAYTETHAKQQVADAAVLAWSECIKLSNGNRTFAEYTTNRDGTGIVGMLVRHVNDQTGIGTIKTISSPLGNAVACYIDNQKIITNKNINLQITRTETNFWCTKAVSVHTHITISTSEGDIPWIEMPSIAVQKNAAIEEVNMAVAALRKQLVETIPHGTVAAFNIDSCPTGWTRYMDAAGRVIVGAGTGDGLSPRAFNERGGEEKHLLTVAEMPRHSHQLPTYNDHPGPDEVGSGHYGKDWIPEEFSKEEGGSQPHNNMQPYLVLTMCVKN